MDNDFVWDMEKMVHNLPNARAFHGNQYDAVWMIPQVVKINPFTIQSRKH